MTISIITVVFNNKFTIENTITSIQEQTYNFKEHIIIDGGSTDGTLDIIMKFCDKSYTKVISEPDNGIYDAMNKGINLATGDIIGILNSDDFYYDKNVLTTVMSHFINDHNIDAVYGDLFYVNKNNTNKIVRKWKSKAYYDNFFENGNVPAHPSFFLKNEIYTKYGFFDTEFKLSADYEFMLRIFKICNIKSKYINTVLVKMRLGGATNKSLKSIYIQNLEVLNAWKKNKINPPSFLMIYRIAKRIKQFI
jgi:glycosyltransferase involved in cell wall biosynthesis